MPCRRLFLLCFLPCTTFWLYGCKPATEAQKADIVAKPLHIASLFAHGDRPFEAADQESLSKQIASNPDVIAQRSDAGNDSRRQALQLLQAASTRPFAIVIRPVDSSVSAELVTKSGTHVIGMGEESIGIAGTTAVCVDEFEIGRLAGTLAVEAMTQKAKESGLPEVTGRVAEIRGDDQSAGCSKRHEGFMEALKTTPGLVLVHDAPGGWTKAGGSQRMQDALRLQKTVDIVYAHNDLMALGAAEATGHQRAHFFIIGTDALPGADGGLALLAQRQINATIYQPPLADFVWAILRRKLADPAFQPKPIYRLVPRKLLPEDLPSFLRDGPPPAPAL
jgi:ABC-type sugar transport system substrate-binding protein